MEHRVSGGKRVALFIIGILALLLLVYQTTDLLCVVFPQTHAEAGFLDLSDYDFRSTDLINLDGQWEFYWEQLLTGSNINSVQPDFYAKVPSTWNRYTLDGEHLPGFGYGSYRLRVRTSLEPGTKMSFQLSTVFSSYVLYVNDTMIASNGVVASDPALSRPEYVPQAANFTVPAQEFDIILQVSNYHHARGGVWYSIILGSTEGVADLYNRRGNRQLFFSGILAFIVLTYFCLFVLLRKAKEYMYLTLLALDAIILTSTMHPALVYQLFPHISFHWLIFWTYASISWTVALLALFTEEMFPARYSKQVVRGIVIYTTVLTLMYALTPVRFYTSISTVLNLIGLLALLFVLYLSLRGILRGIEGSGPYLFGFIVAVFTYVHDTLLANNYIHSNAGELVYVGCAVLFFVQTIVHSIRFTRAYNENVQLLDKLNRVNQQKDEFLFNTAHQIRSPLEAISALTEELLGQSELAASQAENLAQIKAFGSRASNMVSEILDYSYLVKGEVPLRLEQVDLRAVMENVLRVFGMTAQRELESDIPSDLPSILADESRLYQILYNLVGSLDYYSSGQIQVSAEAKRDFIAVTLVSKTEPSLLILSKLQGYIEGSKEVGNIPVTGLTLVITRHLVDQHGGTISVTDADGQGIAFRLTFPAAGGKVALSGGKETDSGVLHIPGSGPHILLVDDNAEALNATAKILGVNGFAVTAVDNGEAALAQIRKNSGFAAVLLDLIIPDMSSYNVCQGIRQIHSALELPILIITAWTAARYTSLAFEAGANDYLAKPFETDVLLARVRTLAYLKQSVDKAVASELAFLQAQIKPHFLFNALSAIAALTIANPQKARSLIIHLSDFLRHSFCFSEAEEMVPLTQEIELVQAYVAIERARFGPQLNFQVTVDECSGVTVPRLVLQPLVENALRHGISKNPQGGLVLLRMERKDNLLVFSVRDDGVGMEHGKVMSLLSGDPGQGVGLSNIHKRMLRYYGSGLTIESSPNLGTTVTFSIPVQS